MAASYGHDALVRQAGVLVVYAGHGEVRGVVPKLLALTAIFSRVDLPQSAPGSRGDGRRGIAVLGARRKTFVKGYAWGEIVVRMAGCCVA